MGRNIFIVILSFVIVLCAGACSGGNLADDSSSTAADSGVSLDFDEVTMYTDYKYEFSAKVTASGASGSVTWKSSDPSIAAVDRYGMVTALAAGSATITATTADGGFKGDCVCTVQDASLSPFEYDNTSGHLLIEKYTGSAASAFIPSEIDDFPVTRISNGAFSTCTELVKVLIPSSVTTIYEGAFTGCAKLTEIIVDGDNPEYAGVNGVLFDKAIKTLCAYPGGKEGAYEIPSTVTVIGDYSVNSCSKLTSVVISPSVTSIGIHAFAHCAGLTSVAIPAGVTNIDNRAFWQCTALTAITVDADNQNYADIDGVVFNKGKTTLIIYPNGRTGEYVIPSGVTLIGWNAFDATTGLTSVDIPETVAEISSWAFNRCTGLKTVIVRRTTPPVIGYWVFSIETMAEIELEAIKVPSEALDEYKATDIWKAYAGIMSAIE